MSDEVFVTVSDLDGHNRPSHGEMEGSNRDEEKSQDCPKSSSNEEVHLVVPCNKCVNTFDTKTNSDIQVCSTCAANNDSFGVPPALFECELCEF